MPDQPAGPLIDALGITLDLDDGQHVTEAMVIAKVTSFDDDGGTTTAMVFGGSDHMDWITQRGLLSAAQYALDENTRVTSSGED